MVIMMVIMIMLVMVMVMVRESGAAGCGRERRRLVVCVEMLGWACTRSGVIGSRRRCDGWWELRGEEERGRGGVQYLPKGGVGRGSERGEQERERELQREQQQEL